ncbi:MAG: AraC family transcriptional regulator [Gammaproteobacteria bacterium]|nr:AraC family transcriptional regulator [Gammaproteobacteria bacterium]
MVDGKRRGQRRIERLEVVLQYIDAHCHEPLDVELLSRQASISRWHFHRVLSSYIGEAVSAYVRRRCLEKAARLLLFHRASATDAAVAAGYATPAGFTRAFRRHFGTSPQRLVRELRDRRPPRAGAAVPEGPVYRRLEPRTVLGTQRFGAYDRAPADAWRAMREFLGRHGAPQADLVRIGIPLDWPEITAPDMCRYEACVESDLKPAGDVFRKRIEGGDYAVFRYRGPCAGLQQALEAIFWYWYPDAGVTLGEGPVFEQFLGPSDPADAGPQGTEIHVPVR